MGESLYLLSQNQPNGGWNAPELLSAQSASSIVAGLNEDGRVELMWIAGDGYLYNMRQQVGGPVNGNYSAVTRLPYQATALAIGSNADHRLEFFFTDQNRNILHGWQSAPNVANWVYAPFGKTQARQIVLGSSLDGRLEMFYIGIDQNIYHHWQAAPNSATWEGGAFRGAAVQLSLIRNLDGRLELFYVGLDSGLYHVWQHQANSDTWDGGTGGATAAGLGGFAKSIATAMHGDGRLELFYIGGDDAIHHNWQSAPNGPWHGGASFGGSAQQLCLCRDQDGRLELFYVGMDGHLYHNWQQNPADTTWAGGAVGVLASRLGSITNVTTAVLILAFFSGYTTAPSGAVAAPSAGFGGSSNYLITNACNPLNNAEVTIEITQDLVCVANGPQQAGATYHAGFSFQMNCYSPTLESDAWQQYVIGIVDGQIYGIINNWQNLNKPVINTKVGLGAAPDGKLLAKWVLGIMLETDMFGNVTKATFVSRNQFGVEASKSLTVNPASILAPIVAFEMNLVGPNNSESATFSTGAGRFIYSSKTAVTAVSSEPPCVGSGGNLSTAETSNATYATMQATPGTPLYQTFSVSPGTAPRRLVVGRTRPPLSIP